MENDLALKGRREGKKNNRDSNNDYHDMLRVLKRIIMTIMR